MFDLKKHIRPNILALQPYSSARDEFTGKEGIFLDANENPFGEMNRYPDPYQNDLKNRLAQLKNVRKEQIFIGNGSDEIIDLAFRIFCTPGQDKVLTFSPSYGMYEVSANINNVELIKVPLDENFQIDLTNLQAYWKDSNIKLLFICSPNNPTGNCLNRKAIEYCLLNFDGLIIIDEAYADFSSEESWVNQVEKYPNLLVTQTFSKAWGLAAARVGIAYSNVEVLHYFNKVKPPYNVSTLNQNAALQALNNIDLFEAQKNILLQERQKLTQALSELPFIQKVYPSDSNFILIKVEDANWLYQQLVEANIIIRNRSKLIENCLRISVGTPKENKVLLDAINTIFVETQTLK